MLLASLHAASRAHRSCHSVSSWDRSSNFGALGLRWWRSPGQIIPSDGFWSRMSTWRTTAFVNFLHRIDFRVFELFRKIVVDFGGSISWNTQPNCRVLDEQVSSTGLPVLWCCSLHELRTCWFSCLVFPGLCDAVETRTSGVLSLHRKTKFIIVFDFAVTLSSPESLLRSFRHHFRTIGRTEMANVKQTQKIMPFITCQISLGQYVCELVFGVNVFDLDLGVQIKSIKQPVKSNSVSPGNMSHCGTSSLKSHLDHCFVVFKHIQQSFLMRRVDVWGNKINIVQIIDHSLRLISFLNGVRCWTNFTFVRLTVLHEFDSCFQELRRSDPTNQVRGYHPTSILHPKNWFLILMNCAKLKFVSYTSNRLKQMYDFPKRITFHLT